MLTKSNVRTWVRGRRHMVSNSHCVVVSDNDVEFSLQTLGLLVSDLSSDIKHMQYAHSGYFWVFRQVKAGSRSHAGAA